MLPVQAKGYKPGPSSISRMLLPALFLCAIAGDLHAQTQPTLSVRFGPQKILEGRSTTVTFRLSEAAAADVGYCFKAGDVDSTGSFGWDLADTVPTDRSFVEVSGTIPAGQREDTVVLRAADDGIDNVNDQRVLVKITIGDDEGALSCDRQYQVSSNNFGGTVRVIDADAFRDAVSVTVEPGQTSVNEGSTAEFEITRSGAVGNLFDTFLSADDIDMDVDFNIRQQGYVFPTDLVAWRVQGDSSWNWMSVDPDDAEVATVTIPRDSASLTIEVDTPNDSVPEIANTNVLVSVLTNDEPYGLGTPSTASVAVEDVGDTPRMEFDSATTTASAAEGDTHLQFGVRQVLSDAPTDVTAQLELSGDFYGATPYIELGRYSSASSPFVDAVSVTPVTLSSGALEFTIPFGESEADSTVRIVRVTLVDDDTSEADGSATLTLPAQHGASAVSQTVAVADDDLPTVTMTAGGVAVFDEGDNITFTLTRDGDVSTPLTIDGSYLQSEFLPSASPAVTSHTVVFSANESSAAFEVASTDDDIHYTIRNLKVTLDPDSAAPFRVPDSPPSGADAVSDADKTQFTLRERENDRGKLSISARLDTVSESAGTACYEIVVDEMFFNPSTPYIFDVELEVSETGQFLASAQETSFNRRITQTGPISANDPDYEVCVGLHDDHVDEEDGSVTLTITGPDGPHLEPDTDAAATVAVTDDDLPVITVDVSQTPVPETDPFDIRFTRAGILDNALSLQRGDFLVASWFPDAAPNSGVQNETAISGLPTFGAGDAQADKNHFFLGNDRYEPGRQLQITVKHNASLYTVPLDPPANAVADLSDGTQTVYRFPFDEPDVGRVRIEAVHAGVDESQQACFSLGLNGYVLAEVTVDVEITGGGDFLASGQDTDPEIAVTSFPHEFCLDLDDDGASENAADLIATVTGVSGTELQVHGSRNTAQIRVYDNEAPLITMTTSATGATEGGTLTLNFARTGDLTQEFTIQAGNFGYWTSYPFANDDVQTSSIVFPADSDTTSVTVTVPEDDNYYVTAPFIVKLSTSSLDGSTVPSNYFSLPATPPTGATGDATETVYTFDRTENDKGWMTIIPFADGSRITEISESAGEVCFEVTWNAVVDNEVDMTVAYEITISDPGGYLDSAPSSFADQLQTRADADGEDVGTRNHCFDLDDDQVSEADDTVTLTFKKITHADFIAAPDADGTGIVKVIDDEPEPAAAVDLQLGVGSQTAYEGNNAEIRVERWTGGPNNAPVEQPVTATVQYEFSGDFWDAPAPVEAEVTVAANDNYGSLYVPVPDDEVHVRNYVLEATLLTGAGYTVRSGYEDVEIEIENDEIIQTVGFAGFELAEGPAVEGTDARFEFVLRRNYNSSASEPELDVLIEIRERPMERWSFDSNGNFQLGALGTYGAQPQDARRLGAHTPDPGPTTKTVTFAEGAETLRIPFDIVDDSLEETASRVKVRVLGGLGYRLTGGAEFGEACPDAPDHSRGCGVDFTWVQNDDNYEHWLKVTPLSASPITEGEDAVFRIERFAIRAEHGGLHLQNPSPLCTNPSPETATRIALGNIDYRVAQFGLSGHESVAGAVGSSLAHMAPGVGSVDVTIPTVDDTASEEHATVVFSIEENLAPTLRYTRPYYCILSGQGSASIQVRDNDTLGVTVSETALPVSEGGTATYTVVLESEPSGDVTVTPSRSSGDADVTVSGALTFTTSNWETEQTVTVSAAEDADAVNDTATISHAVDGADYGSNNIAAADVAITVADDESASSQIALTVDETSVAEAAGATAVTVTAALNGAPLTADATVTVSVGTGSDSAEEGTDYSTVADFALTITAGQNSGTATFTLTPDDDDLDEDDESLTIGGSTTVTGLTVSGTAITITDDDTRGVTVSESALPVSEGGTATYTVVLGSEPTGDVTITPSRASGDADVTVSDALTFTSSNWETEQTVTVSAAQDADAENDTATISHAVAGADYVSNGVTAADVAVTVTDDETASNQITLSVNESAVDEAAGATTVTVTGTLNGAAQLSDVPVTVSVGAGGDSATEGTDYSTVSDFALTIVAGQNSGTATFTLSPDDDDIDEDDESLTVGGSTTVSGLTVSETAITITDDDTRGVTVSESALPVSEGGTATYTVVLGSEPTADVTITPSRTSGDADVTVSDALTFAPSNWDTAQTVTVSAAEDADAVNDTATISHAVAGADYGSNGVTANDVAVTVNDNETASNQIALSVNETTVDEDAGATAVTVTATLNGAPHTADVPVTVSVGSGSDSATEGTDYSTVSDFALTISANQNSGTATFTLTPDDDDLDEANESLTVAGSTTVTGLSVSGTSITITDDDTRGVTVSRSSATVPEGGSETYTVVLDSRPTGNVAVTPSRSSGSGDVTVSGTLTFTPSNWETEQTVTVSAAQDADAVNDTATISHTVSGADYGSNNVTANDVAITVADDETASSQITLSVNKPTVDEDAGATAVTVTGTLNGAALISDATVTVSVGTGSDSATEGTDYTTVSDFALTISANQNSGTATFTLTPDDDDLDEANESLTVAGSTTVTGLSVSGTSITITDNDTRGVTVSRSSATVPEGGSETYTVVLDSRPTGNVAVTPSRSSGSGDVTVSGALTFTPSNWETEQTVTVSAAQDADAVTDTATIAHTVSGADYGSNNVTANDVAITVADDETASNRITLSVNKPNVDEDAGATDVTVTATLNGAPHTSNIPVTVSVGAGSDSATEGADYATVSNFALTITAGQSSGTATFTLTPDDDDLDEANESLTVSGSTSVTGLSVSGTSITITDDDTRGITVSTPTLQVPEAFGETYTVVLESQPTGSVTVTPSRASGSADVTVSGTLTFMPSNWETEQTVTVSAAQDADAINDTATISHSVAGADYGSNGVTAADVAVTVSDDETASSQITLSVNKPTVDEDAGATDVTVTATLNGAPHTSNVPVTVSVGSGSDSATEGTDYSNVASFTLTITANQSSGTATFTLTPDDDDLDEANESLTVAGSTTVTGLSVSGTSITITDDDTRGVTVSRSSATVPEGGSETYTVVLESQPTGNVTITPSRSSGSNDVTVSGALIFTPSNWETEQTVTVSAAQDSDAVNDTATISHAVSGADYGSNNVTAAGVAVTVSDDETASSQITLSVNKPTVDEDAGATTVTVTGRLNGAPHTSNVPVTVSVGTGSDSATEGTDYATVSNFALTITAGQSSGTATFTLTPDDDDLDEANESLTVAGSTTATGLTVSGTTITIADDDTRGVTVSRSSATVPEGGTETYTVVLDSKPTGDVTITPSRGSGDSDVTVSGTLTFTPSNWDTRQTVTISAAHDADAEDDTATISHSVSGADYGTNNVTASDVSVTVEDDETESTKVDIGVTKVIVSGVEATVDGGSLSVDEGGGAVTVTISASLDGAPNRTDTNVVLAVGSASDAAAEGSDYQAVDDLTLTIPAGETEGSVDFVLTPIDDDVDEEDENLTVTRSGSAGDLAVQATVITIEDDDTRGVTVSRSSATVSEGGSETYTVALNSQPTANVTITPSRSGGDADVTVSGALMFTPSNWETEQTVTVSAAEDADAENDTATISHSVTGADYGSNGVTANDVAITVTDDETASNRIALSVNEPTVDEDAGATTVTVTGTLDGAPLTSDAAVTVTVGASSDTAVEGTDYAAVGNLTLTITAGQTNGTATFTLTPDDDRVDEANESLTVGGSTTVTGLSVSGTAITITDNDTRGVSVSESSLTISEGGRETYTVVLESRPTGNVTVAPSRASGDTDVTVSGSLTFTPSNWETEQTVTVSAAQDADAENDTATISHSVSGADYGSNGVTANDVAVEVTDDETASSQIALSVNQPTVDEDAGATTVTVTATLNGAPHTANVPVTVTVGDSGDTAAEGADYALVSDLALTITAGQTAGAATFSLTPVDDDLDEANESLTVAGSTALTGLSVSETGITIIDDDTRGVTLSRSSVTVPEGGTETYTVVLDSQPTGNVTITPSRASGDADVTASGALTFTPSNWETEQNVTVSAAGDADAVDDTATISHDVSGADYGENGVTAADVSVTVEDDETASSRIALTVDEISVGEAAGSTTVTVTGTLDGAPLTSDAAVTVIVGDSSDAAAEGVDYAQVNDLALTIAAGQTTGTATFALAPVNDSLDEENESLSVNGSTAVTGLSVSGTGITITDDDTRGVTLSRSAATVPEGGSETYTVVLDSEPTGDVTVTPSRASGDADVTVSGALTFTPSDWNTEQTVTVSAAEDADSVNDEATLSHAVAGADYGSNNVAAGDVAITVADDETASSEIALTVDEPTVDEDAGATAVTVTGTLNGAPLTADAAVTVSVGDSGDAAAEGTDYAAVADFSLTITAGQSSGTATFTLTPADDDLVEADESLTVNGSTAVTGLTVAGTAIAIADNDARGVTVSTAALTVPEGGSETYTIVLDSQPTGDVTVTPSRASGDEDVTVSAALTFTPSNWETEQTVTVSAAGDADAVNDTATISHAVDGADYGSNGVAANDVAITVEDDETASSRIALSVDEPALDEDAGATTVTVTGTLNGAPLTSDASVTVSVGAAGDSAVEGADYAQVNDLTLTIAAGQMSGTAAFTLTPEDDALDEETESLTVGGTTAVSGVAVAGTAITIADNDARGVTVSESVLTVPEGGSETYAIVLDSQPTGDVTVTPSRASGDEDVTVSGALTFATSNWSVAQTVTVSAAEDADATNDEATISHAIAGADYASEPVGSVSVEVTDDDTASNRVALTVDETSVSEDAGAVTVTVTATLNDAALASDASVAVSVGAAGDDAAEGVDYAQVDDLTLTIAAGQMSGAATFTLTPVDDALDEDEESLTVGGATAVEGLTVTGASIAITDDDTRGVTVSASTLIVPEGGSETYTVVLDSQPAGDVTIAPSRSSGDEDVSVSDALTFTPSNWNAAQTVTVSAAEDEDAAGDEATISHAVAGADYASETAESVSVTVADNESASSAVTLAVDSESIGEGAGETDITVTATLNGAPLTSDAAVTVLVGAAGDTAEEGADYAAVDDLTLTIAAGRTSGTATFTLTPEDDALDEADESLTVAGSTTVAGLSVTGTGIAITDDDTRGVTLSTEALTVPEGASETYTIALDSQPTADVTVTPSHASGDPDVTVAGALIFTPSNWNVAQTVTVSAAEDADARDDRATVSHAVAGADYASVTAGDVLVTVMDDDNRGVRVSDTELTIPKGGTEEYTVVLESEPTGDVTVTPVPPDDVNLEVGGPLVFTPTNWEEPQPVSVHAPDESVTNAVIEHVVEGADYEENNVEADDVQVSVPVENDPAPEPASRVKLTVDTGSVREDAGAVNVKVTATLDGAPLAADAAVTVAVGAAGDSAVEGTDYTAVADFVLIVGAGDSSATAEIVLTPADDAIDETDESLTITGTAADSGLAVSGTAIAIADDDARGVSVSDSSLTVSEGGSATYAVALESQPTGGVTVSPSRASGDTDVTVSGAVTFTPSNWNAAQTVTVSAAHDDDTADDAATVSHAVSGADYGSVPAGSVSVAVEDDDSDRPATLSLGLGRSSISEGAGSDEHSVEIAVTLDRAYGADLDVTLTVAGKGARETEDFVAVAPRTLRIPAGELSASETVSVVPVNDAVDEDDESILISAGVTASDVQLAQPSGVELLILDDDTRGITVSPTKLRLPDGGSAIYLLSMNSRPTGPVSIAVSGHAGGQLGVAPAQLIFTPDNWSEGQSVEVTAQPADATFVLTHTASGGDYGSVAVASVEVIVSRRDDIRSAAGGALAATSRMLLDSATGVFDGRRREAMNRGRSSLDEPVSRRAGAALYRLAQMADGGRMSATQQMGHPSQSRPMGHPQLMGHPSESMGHPQAMGVPLPAMGHSQGMGVPQAMGVPQSMGHPYPAGRSGAYSAGHDAGWERMLWNRSFSVSLDSVFGDGERGDGEAKREGGAEMTFWGVSDLQSLRGQPGGDRFDGDLRSVYLGLDRRFGEDWLAGLAVSRAAGDVDYRSDGNTVRLESTLSSLYPYLQGKLSDDVDFWLLSGFGQGDATAGWAQASAETGGLGMGMAAGGFSVGLAQLGRMQLSMIGDAGFLSLDVDDGPGALNGLESSVRRLRVGVEGQLDYGILRPFWQLSARSDGGDGPTGAGVELVAGLGYDTPRVKFETLGRWFALNSVEAHRQYSASAQLTVTARADGGGLMLRLAPQWGNAGAGIPGRAGGALALWEDPMSAAGMRMPAGGEAGLSVDGEIGWGFVLPRLNALLTPTLTASRHHARERIMSLGLMYESSRARQNDYLDIGFTFGREIGRREEPVYGLRVVWRF